MLFPRLLTQHTPEAMHVQGNDGQGSDSHAYNVVLINFFQNSVMCDSLVVIRELLKRDRNYQIFFMKILWQRFFRGIRESFLPRM